MATPHGMQDLSSLTRDWTHALIRFSWWLNELIHVKSLKQCLEQSGYSNNVLLWFLLALVTSMVFKMLTTLVFLKFSLIHISMEGHFPSDPPTSLAIHPSYWLLMLYSVFMCYIFQDSIFNPLFCSIYTPYQWECVPINGFSFYFCLVISNLGFLCLPKYAAVP